jgi:hypothetical protein
VRACIAGVIKQSPFFHLLRNSVVKRRQADALSVWERSGRPVPVPHLVKQATLHEYANHYDLRILVETGTLYGDMVEAMRTRFDRIYSIELSQALYEAAVIRFRKDKKIEIIQGDSGITLGQLMPRIDQPALFWLDGHYSGGITARGAKDTPIFEELHHVLSSGVAGHVVIIDDARCFGMDPAYPTLDELFAFVGVLRPDVDLVVQNDSIRITPRASSTSPGPAPSSDSQPLLRR